MAKNRKVQDKQNWAGICRFDLRKRNRYKQICNTRTFYRKTIKYYCPVSTYGSLICWTKVKITKNSFSTTAVPFNDAGAWRISTPNQMAEAIMQIDCSLSRNWLQKPKLRNYLYVSRLCPASQLGNSRLPVGTTEVCLCPDSNLDQYLSLRISSKYAAH